jgi:hypothetical protein
VEADHSTARREISSDRSRPAGIGDSDIPASALDMKTAAIRIHAQVKSLAVDKVRVVGRDIGPDGCLCLCRAAPYQKSGNLSSMDAFLPGVAGWEDLQQSPKETTDTLLIFCEPGGTSKCSGLSGSRHQ